jgi:hypothetical protein
LKQTDFNGRSETFNPVAVNFNIKAIEITKAHTEDHTFKIELLAPIAEPAAITVYDITGKLIVQTSVLLNEGYNDISIPAGNIIPGIHMIRILNTGNSISKKFIL